MTETFYEAETFQQKATRLVFTLRHIIRTKGDISPRDQEEIKDFLGETELSEPTKNESTKMSYEQVETFSQKTKRIIRLLVNVHDNPGHLGSKDRDEALDFLKQIVIFESQEIKDTNPDYSALDTILERAFNQAASGKGKERHADSRPFEKQPIMRVQELVGSGFALGQAIKKIQESTRLDTPKASIELLGAIVYLAAAIIFQENKLSEEEE